MTHHLFLGMFEAPSLLYQNFLSLARHFTLRWTRQLGLLVPCSPIVWTQQVHSKFVHNCAWKFHSSALDSVPMCIQVYSTMHQVHPTLSICTQLHPSAFNCAQVDCYMPKVGISQSLSKGACYARCVSYNN